NALEPEWEARFEPRSYGFRPGRSCQDAIRMIHSTCKGPRAKRVWVLDADLAAAFDRIDHDYLLGALGGFPAKEMIAGWLKAGVFSDAGGNSPGRGDFTFAHECRVARAGRSGRGSLSHERCSCGRSQARIACGDPLR